MAGNQTCFRNTVTGSAFSGQGVRLANTAGATSVTYTYSAGTGSTDIPANVSFARWLGTAGVVAGGFEMANSAASQVYFEGLGNATNVTGSQAFAVASSGLRVAGANTTHDIFIVGFVDGTLGVGANPLL